MNQQVADKLVARLVRAGNNEAEARKLLDEQVRDFAPRNLACALVHWGFATAARAQRDAAALLGVPA